LSPYPQRGDLKLCGLDMSSLVKEHLSRLQPCEFIKPLAAATTALLAWKYLPSMTDELWNHALQFLDRYRTESPNNRIEDLYQFVDPTGILEQHQKMLSQPFSENQVDMKILYYQLIKMLIDYERKNNPSAYDATKAVGKVEGYQELTNKLQRFLNQHFLLDIQKLNKKQEDFSKALGGDIESVNVVEKLEKLEHQVNLQEETNRTLMNEISKLKERETDHKVFFDYATKKLEHFESVELSIEEANRKVVERVESIELDGKVLDRKVIKLTNQHKSDLDAVSEHANNNAQDVKQIIEKNQEIGKMLENKEMLSKQKWQCFESSLEFHKKTMNEIKCTVLMSETETEELKESFFRFSKDLENTSLSTTKNSESIIDMKSKILDQTQLFNDMYIGNKIKQLEDGYTKHETKIQNLEIENRNVSKVEEVRQHTDASMREEMEERARNSQNTLENIRKDIFDNAKNVDTKIENISNLCNEQNQSLKNEIKKSLDLNESRVSAAKDHVNNLRELNSNLINQVKEKSECTIEKSRIYVQEILTKFQDDLDKNISKYEEKTLNHDTAIGDLKSKIHILDLQVTAVVGNEEKIKDIVNTLESNQTLEQTNNKTRSFCIENEQKNMKRGIQELQSAADVQRREFNDQLDKKQELCQKNQLACSNTINDQAKTISDANDKLSAIMDTASKLMMNCAEQDENVKSLDKMSKDVEKKLLDLESADLFLQESLKQVLERTDVTEKQSKLFENNITKIGEKHRIEMVEELQKESKTFLKKMDGFEDCFNQKLNELEKDISIQKLSCIEDKKEIFENIESVQKKVSDEMSKLENQMKEEHSNKDNELKTEKVFILKKIEDQNLNLKTLENNFEAIKTNHLIEMSQMKNRIEEKTGLTFDERLNSLEKKNIDKKKQIKESENISSKRLQSLEIEFIDDSRNKKEELKKLRYLLASHTTCMTKTRHQLDAVLLHLHLTA